MSQPATVSLVGNGLFPENKHYRYSNSVHLEDPVVLDEPLHEGNASRLHVTSNGDSETVRPRKEEAVPESPAGPSDSSRRIEGLSQAKNEPCPLTPEQSTKEASSFLSGSSRLSTTPVAPLSPSLRAVEEPSTPTKAPVRSFRGLFLRTANNIRGRSGNDFAGAPSMLSSRNGRPSTSSRPTQACVTSVVEKQPESQGRRSPEQENENASLSSRSSRASYASQKLGNLRKLMKVSTGMSLLGKSKTGLTSSKDETLFQIKFPTFNNLKDQLRFSNFTNSSRCGAESKDKQPMTSPLDDIQVDTFELMDTFVTASKIPGRGGREIAKGSTATVKVMYRKGTASVLPYAVKEFRKVGSGENPYAFETQIKSEFSIANSLHHPNIVETICLCTHAGRWNHVMEYCGQGELFSLVKKGYLQMDDKFCLFKQLLQGVEYLHSNGIAHRDIKLENLLLTDYGHLKITDFGVAVVFSGPHPGLRTAYYDCEEPGEVRKCAPGICGSLPYIAPEVLKKDAEYDPRPLDVWSCGIVCLALFFQGTPWQEATRNDPNYSRFLTGWEKFVKENPDGKVDSYNYPSCGRVFNAFPKPVFRRLLLQMLQPNPSKRVPIHDALYDRWVKRIECCCPDPEAMRGAIQRAEASMDDNPLANRLKFKLHNHCAPSKRGFFPRNWLL